MKVAGVEESDFSWYQSPTKAELCGTDKLKCYTKNANSRYWERKNVVKWPPFSTAPSKCYIQYWTLHRNEYAHCIEMAPLGFHTCKNTELCLCFIFNSQNNAVRLQRTTIGQFLPIGIILWFIISSWWPRHILRKAPWASCYLQMTWKIHTECSYSAFLAKSFNSSVPMSSYCSFFSFFLVLFGE